ncbi:MAG TPA: response regulator transcription factor [Bacteroidales bacterium]|nr:response regulator transcription factor [Bacteroidales bacterium]
MLKAIVVDDEQRARESITTIIGKLFPEIDLLGEAEGVESAFHLIEKGKPDVVFLDIKMGDGTGFDLLRRYQRIPFKVVFITAFDEHAIEAFKFSAFDYLLKPINTNELRATIERLKDQLDQEEELSVKIQALLSNVNSMNIEQKKIVLKTANSIHLVKLVNIIRCEADANYTWVYVQGQPKLLISKPLKHFDELLDGFGFFRVHQSHLINLNFVSRIDKTDGGTIILNDNTSIPIATRKRDQLFQLLENL